MILPRVIIWKADVMGNGKALTEHSVVTEIVAPAFGEEISVQVHILRTDVDDWSST